MKEPWKLFNYWKREAMCICLVTISGILYNVGMLAGPIFQGKMLDALQQREGQERVLVLTFLFVCAIVIVQVFRYIKRFYIRRFANETSATMRLMIYNNIMNKTEEELKQENLGSLMTKAISDVEACVEGMRKFTTEVFDTGVLLISYLITLFLYDNKVTLAACICIPIAMLIAQNLKMRIVKYTFAYRKQLSEVSTITYDYIENAMLYRLYGREEENQEAYEIQLQELENKAIWANVWENAMQPIYNVIAMTGVIVVIVMLGGRVVDKSFTIGMFVTYITIFTAMAFKASKAAKLFNSVQKATVSWRRIKPYMEEYREDRADVDSMSSKDLSKIEVQLSNLSIPYGVEHLDLSLSEGDIIGITGPIACGKSTFGKTFLGLSSYVGSIKIGGVELSKMEKAKRSQLIAYLGHEPQLLSDTIYENITLGDKEDVSKVLTMVCFEKDLESMKEGVQTRVGNGGVRLSGGQQSRIALARTLYHKKKILIVDDPFSAVDPATEKEILEQIKENTTDCIVFLISHRLAQFDKVDKVLLMHADKSYEIGTHKELLETSELYQQLYYLQEK